LSIDSALSCSIALSNLSKACIIFSSISTFRKKSTAARLRAKFLWTMIETKAIAPPNTATLAVTMGA
jgi:hypothetical protein